MLERLFPQQADDKLFVEDVFSTYLYTGNGATQTITNGIDLAGKGGMLWRKSRGSSGNHVILDTVRGIASYLESNTTSAAGTGYNWIASFNSDGFTNNNNSVNNGDSVSWTFREAPNFFDVVTYTGDGTNNRSIAHNLGIAPGMIIVKNTTSTQSWIVYHRSTGTGNFTILNSTGAVNVNANAFPTVSSTAFVPTANQAAFSLNTSGQTFVAYLFAHDPTSDGLIQCGSFGGGGALQTVTLGWEPQWVLTKPADVGGSDWRIFDTMRGMPAVSGGGQARTLRPNTSGAEGAYGNDFLPTATGFQAQTSDGSNNTIYVAIRRGPMRTPTLGTSVFSPVARTGTGAAATVNVGFAPDFATSTSRAGFEIMPVVDKLRGPANWLRWKSQMTNAESSIYSGQWFTSFTNTGVTLGADNGGGVSVNSNGTSLIQYYFQRAPGFMDVVCYTGTGSTRTVAHNLGVAPELMIVKRRNDNADWVVYAAPLGATKNLYLPSSDGVFTNPFWNDTNPTSSVFTIGGGFPATNASGSTYVAYLFASVPGVSKVGSYTGNGSSQTINCAFTTGARFVLIKRTDSTGDWYVWDSARGIVAGNDPYLALNTTAAEVTTNDSVDTDSTGFVVNQVAASNINVNAATYIYLAIA